MCPSSETVTAANRSTTAAASAFEREPARKEVQHDAARAEEIGYVEHVVAHERLPPP